MRTTADTIAIAIPMLALRERIVFSAERHSAQIPACKLRSPKSSRGQESAVPGILCRVLFCFLCFSRRVDLLNEH
jgi:hypothetical protein